MSMDVLIEEDPAKAPDGGVLTRLFCGCADDYDGSAEEKILTIADGCKGFNDPDVFGKLMTPPFRCIRDSGKVSAPHEVRIMKVVNGEGFTAVGGARWFKLDLNNQ